MSNEAIKETFSILKEEEEFCNRTVIKVQVSSEIFEAIENNKTFFKQIRKFEIEKRDNVPEDYMNIISEKKIKRI
jgi:hypothetical protein